MSVDSSLRSKSGLAQHRNVLTRAERIAKLAERSGFDPASDTPIRLPKVANRKIVTGKKSKKKGPEEPGAEGDSGAAPPAGS
jgi:small basic protein (TIGR04137 family)